MRPLARGLVAGAAGTVALNIVTYLDMIVRARPASSTPEESAKRLAAAAGISLGEGRAAENRAAGIGPLLGYATGLGCTVAYSILVRRRLPWPLATAVLSGMALLGSNAPMTVLGVTDPREWTATDWLADLIPHLAYGAVAAAVDERLR
jgi:hypothetical protein